jgi:hypothetical protein
MTDGRNPWESETIEKWPVDKLRGYARNPREHPRESIDAIKASIVNYGFVTPPLIDESGEIICGHGRVAAAVELGIVRVPVIVARGWSPEKIRGYRISDNSIQERSFWNVPMLRIELGDLGRMNFPLTLTAFPEVRLRDFGVAPDGSPLPEPAPTRTLAEQFGVPPFSVLNARAGWWQVRKAAWIALGMEPELGRSKTEQPIRGTVSYADVNGGPGASTGVFSLFDPTLAELLLRWFCPPGGIVWNPFMGESSIGIVASRLGRRYTAVDVRPEQVAANKAQSDLICRGFPEPRWLVGDGAMADPEELCRGQPDFVLSSPPFWSLERYSDDPQDLSTMGYPEFLAAYRQIIARAYDALKPDRFAAFIVGEVRGPDGNYVGFVPDTIRAFMDAGFGYYNEAILVTAAGSLPVRTRRQFETSRKFGRTHQTVAVFCKGDPKRATAAVGPVEFGEPTDGEPLAEAGGGIISE